MKEVGFNGNGDDTKFSLATENELLMLKLQAEFGAFCVAGGHELPPEVVNDFLQSVYTFEKKLREPRVAVTIYEQIGSPTFAAAAGLSEDMAVEKLREMIVLLDQHGIELEVLGDYDSRTIYAFITEQFFQVQMEDPGLPGFRHRFCYEDFHPNHELDISQRCAEFMSQWFAGEINEYSWEMADMMIHPDSRLFSKERMLRKLQIFFQAFNGFREGNYQVDELAWEWDEQREHGKAYVRGSVRYAALLHNQDKIIYEGHFEFYLSNQDGWWTIYYFTFPGFSWNDEWPD